MITSSVEAYVGPPVPMSTVPFLLVVVLGLLGIGAAVLFAKDSDFGPKRHLGIWLAGIAAVSLGGSAWYYYAMTGPIEDPTFFCTAPDPSPLPTLAGTTVVGDCSSGTTVAVRRGQLIAVDLQAETGWDTWTQFTNFSVSDGQVLALLAAPSFFQAQRPGLFHEVALYQAGQPGQATISALQQNCSGNTNSCDRGHRWKVTIQVT